MVITILTPNEARQARTALGLSQSKAAQGVGMNRSQLALFEVKKYLLDDETLVSLKQFYESQGFTFSGPESDVQPEAVQPSRPVKSRGSTGIRLIDGFAVPEGIGADEAETLLNELADNDRRIAQLASKKAGVGWWDDAPKKDGLNELLRLHARNYLLTRQLQGHQLLTEEEYSKEAAPESVSNGKLLYDLINR